MTRREYFRRLGVDLADEADVRNRPRWQVLAGWLFALALGTGFWWFFIWAGTRLWSH